MPLKHKYSTSNLAIAMGLSHRSSVAYAETLLERAGFKPQRVVTNAQGKRLLMIWPKAAYDYAVQVGETRESQQGHAEAEPVAEVAPTPEPEADTSHQPDAATSLANLLVRLEAKIDVLHERLDDVREQLFKAVEASHDGLNARLDDIEQAAGETKENVEILLNSLTEPEVE